MTMFILRRRYVQARSTSKQLKRLYGHRENELLRADRDQSRLKPCRCGLLYTARRAI